MLYDNETTHEFMAAALGVFGSDYCVYRWVECLEFSKNGFLVVERLADMRYRLATGEISTVKEGFVFDWASIPLLFTWYIPPAGDGKNCYGIAALFHDWLYCHRKIGGRPVTRAECDGLFLEIMFYVGVTRWLAYTMWLAVRVGGCLPWWRRADKDIIP